MMEDIKELKKKVDVYFSNNIYTFIKKENGTFLNGIIKRVDKDFFIVEDDMMGECPVLFTEIIKIDVSTRNKKGCDENGKML